MSDLEILPLVGESPEQVIELWRRTGLPHRPMGRDLPDALREEFHKNEDLALGAYVEDELIGTVLATDDGRKGWINRLAVDPAHRRRGVATRLLHAAEAALRVRGRRIMAALLETWNAESIAFFQAKGYHLHEDIHYMSKREGEEV